MSFAAVEDVINTPRLQAMGGAGCAMTGCSGNLFYNPGAMVRGPGWDFVLYTARFYGMDELSCNCLYARTGTSMITLAAGAYSYGNSLYREQVFCLAAGVKTTDAAWLGAAVRYANLEIQKYGSAGTMLLDVGGLFKLTPSVNWGWAVRNANAAVLGQCKEELPQIYISGVCIQPVSNVNVCFDLYKDVRFPIELRSGVEFSPLPALAIRVGGADRPRRFTAGFGLKIGFVALNYAYNAHSLLAPLHIMTITLGD